LIEKLFIFNTGFSIINQLKPAKDKVVKITIEMLFHPIIKKKFIITMCKIYIA